MTEDYGFDLYNSQVFKLLFEQSSDGIIVNKTDGTIIAANPSACKIFNCSREELCRIGLNGIIDLKDETVYEAVYERNETGDFCRHIDIIRQDGSVVSVIATSTLVYNANYNETLSYIFIRNLSSLKKIRLMHKEFEEKFYKTFMNSPTVMTISDLKTNRYIDVNNQFEKVLGYSREEVVGRTPLEIGLWKNPKQRSEVLDEISNVLEGKRVENINVDYLNSNGDIIHTLSSFHTITISGMKYLLNNVIDITEKIRLSNGLKQKKQLLEQFFNNSLDIHCILDYEGKIIKINPAFKEVLGYSESDLEKHWMSFIYQEDKDRTMKALTKTYNNREPLLQFQNRIISKNGFIKWMEWMAIHDIEKGLIYTVGRDITKRKKSEAATKFLASIVESTDDAIIGKDINGIILSWNKAAEKIYGYTSEEVMGNHISILAPADLLNESQEKILTNIRKGKLIKNFETVRMRKDGKLIYVSLTISPIRDENDNINGASTIVKDITERKQQEDEILKLDRLITLGEMAACISHEVRNPLTTVRGFLQLLGDKEEYDKDKNFFDLMIEELDRANSIISEFLRISKTEDNAEFKTQNLNQIIKDIVPLLQADAVVKSNYIELELSDIPNLLLSKDQIRQVIINLVRNALEAMDANGKVTIKTYAENENVVMAIEDQGCGISSDVLQNIGKPFFTTKEEGTGLGLQTCYKICQRHNAIIDIKTSTQGTEFLLKFKNL